MRFDNQFTVKVPIKEAWTLLMDVPRIAPCLPGARLTETLEGNRYKGEAALKVGPVQLLFAGEALMSSIDPVAHTARVTAKGADRKGRGAASASVSFALAPQGSSTRVDVSTDLTLTGAVAQYGRASGLIQEIASQLVAQFATNLEDLIRDSAPPPEAPNREAANPQPAAPAPSTERRRAAAPPPAPPASAPISAFSLVGSALGAIARRWLQRMLGR